MQQRRVLYIRVLNKKSKEKRDLWDNPEQDGLIGAGKH
jgi:hypothetical protein